MQFNKGSSNTAVGYQSLWNNATGQYNTANGYQSLFTNTTGSNNTAIGYFADVSSNNLTNATAIGYNAKVAISNAMVLGGTGANAIKVGIGMTSPSVTLDVLGTASSTGLQVNGNATTTGNLVVSGTINRNPVITLGTDLSGSVTLTNLGSGTLNATIAANSVDGTNIALGSDATGDIMYYSGTDWVRKAGSAGFLKSTGAVAPAWSSIVDADVPDTITASYYLLLTGGTVTGNLALSKATGGNSLVVDTNGLVYDSTNNRVGIGTASPAQTLDVVGNIKINTSSAYMLNGVYLAYGDTALFNYYFGEAGDALSYFHTIGSQNTAVGHYALAGGAAGWDGQGEPNVNTYYANTAIGAFALSSSTTGSLNTAMGRNALRLNTTGNQNTANGTGALYANSTGSDSVAEGDNALFDYIGSGAMTAIGINAGAPKGFKDGSWDPINNTSTRFNSRRDASSTFIGHGASRDNNTNPDDVWLYNATAIGYNARVGASNTLVLGGKNETDIGGTDNRVKVGIGTSTPAYTLTVVGTSTAVARFISGASSCTITAGTGIACTSDVRLKNNISSLDESLNKIMNLRPVSFAWNADNTNATNYGFIAQEVESVIPELVTTDSGGMKSLSMLGMVPFLTGAIQQQQTEINNLSNQINSNINSIPNNTPLVVSDSNPVIDNLRVTQSADFYGTITVIGEAGFQSKVTFEKDVEIKGKLYVDKDQAGTVTIVAGSTTASVIFNQPYDSTPKIVANLNYSSTSPAFARFAISDKSTSSFAIILDAPAVVDLSFDWMALGVKDVAESQASLPAPNDAVSGGQVAGAQETVPTPTPSSTDPIIEPTSTEPIVPIVEPTSTDPVPPVVESTSTTP